MTDRVPAGSHPELMTAYSAELERGYSSLARGELAAAFQCFERAHILGQRRTRLHVRAHLAMLKVGWLRRDQREIRGQLSRIVAASLFSRIWVPDGNTGGANVSARKRMPIPEDLQSILTRAAGER
jgi:Protein of unknown function (DUF3703)